jgi:hypothetical protein
VVFLVVLLISVIRHESSARGSAAGISRRNPARKDSAWEANGAREALVGAKNLCRDAGAELLKLPATAEWDDAQAAFAAETSPGRYRVRRTILRRNLPSAGSHTTIECRVRRDGDHFQLISIDSAR